jgi:phosphoribosylformylglycinamidine (FGAM) synthase PurS component
MSLKYKVTHVSETGTRSDDYVIAKNVSYREAQIKKYQYLVDNLTDNPDICQEEVAWMLNDILGNTVIEKN